MWQRYFKINDCPCFVNSQFYFNQIPGDGEQYINVTKVLVHPNYNTKTQDFDYSILQVK